MSNEPRSQHRTTRYLLACGLAPALFTAVLLVDGVTRPGYEPLYRWGSELSLGDRGWLQIANFIVTGLLTVAFAIGLRRVLGHDRKSLAGSVLIALFVLTLVVAGVFVTDSFPGYPPGSSGSQPTLAGSIHDYNALPNFLALTAAVFVLARRFPVHRGGRIWTWYSLATGVIVPATFVASIVLVGLGGPHGLLQRITIAVGFGWISVLAVRLLRDHSRQHLPVAAALDRSQG